MVQVPASLNRQRRGTFHPAPGAESAGVAVLEQTESMVAQDWTLLSSTSPKGKSWVAFQQQRTQFTGSSPGRGSLLDWTYGACRMSWDGIGTPRMENLKAWRRPTAQTG